MIILGLPDPTLLAAPGGMDHLLLCYTFIYGSFIIIYLHTDHLYLYMNNNIIIIIIIIIFLFIIIIIIRIIYYIDNP